MDPEYLLLMMIEYRNRDRPEEHLVVLIWEHSHAIKEMLKLGEVEVVKLICKKSIVLLQLLSK